MGFLKDRCYLRLPRRPQTVDMNGSHLCNGKHCHVTGPAPAGDTGASVFCKLPYQPLLGSLCVLANTCIPPGRCQSAPLEPLWCLVDLPVWPAHLGAAGLFVAKFRESLPPWASLSEVQGVSLQAISQTGHPERIPQTPRGLANT